MTTRTSTQNLIYDWNVQSGAVAPHIRPRRAAIEFADETLRDGLQSPSVTEPTIEQKLDILHLIARLGVRGIDLGLPGAGQHAVADITRLAQEISTNKLLFDPYCAVRTHVADITPLVEICQKTGLAIEAAAFIGSSPIRQFAEGWTIEDIIRRSVEAVDLAVKNNVPVMYVTEDTTRATPDDIRKLYTAAIDHGAARICVCDTCGHITPHGVGNLLSYIFDIVKSSGAKVLIDWHGHNDRGLGVANSLAAVSAGVDRVHGTALGIGERVGNASLDQILVNLKLDGVIDNDLTALAEYCDKVSRYTHTPIPPSYPVMGADAFRTATGVHAAAIIKAEKKGDKWLADRVYSGVSAGDFGKEQVIDIGFMSGMSNIVYWLAKHGVDGSDDELKRIAERVFELAKHSDHNLADTEIMSVVRDARGATPSSANAPH